MARLVYQRQRTILSNNNMTASSSTSSMNHRHSILILGLLTAGVSALLIVFQHSNACITTTSNSPSSSLSSFLLDYYNANVTTSSATISSLHQQLQQQQQFTSCLQHVLENLPIGPGRRAAKRNPLGYTIVAAHHYDANTDNNLKKWNAGDRFLPMPQLLQRQRQLQERGGAEDCIVWEVGAHKKADDSKTLLQHYPHCTYHAFEPIPDYFKVLQSHWNNGNNRHRNNMNLHNFGIGGWDATLQVPLDALQEQATYLGDSSSTSTTTTTATAVADSASTGDQSNGNFVQVQIKSFANAMAEAAMAAASGSGSGRKQGELKEPYYPTLLHMNCEGCEWDLLPQGLDAGFIQHVPVIQIGFHNYGHEHGLGGRVWQLCEIRQRLSATHTIMTNASVPFAWERWVLTEETN